MGCLLSFKWILAIIGYRLAGGKGFILGFLVGWYIDSLINRPTIHFTFRRGPMDGGGGYQRDEYYRQQTGGWQQAGGQQTGGWQPYRNVALEQAYQTLGIPSTATDDEVRQAYRRLALQFHPDRVAAQGEAARQQAEKKFQEITQARDIIMQSRGQ